METLKVLAICLLISLVQAELQVIQQDGENPFTLLRGKDLYTIWKSNNSIYTSSTAKNYKPCKIAIDPMKDYVTFKIEVTEIPDTQKVIVSGLQDYDDDDNGIAVNFTILLVDLQACNYKSVLIPEDKRPSNYDDWPYTLPNVIAYPGFFDIFLPSQQICSPCRFNSEGEKIELDHQLNSESEELTIFGFDIQPVNRMDPNEGYIYSRNLMNDTAVIKYFDSNFEIISEAVFSHPIHSVTIDSTQNNSKIIGTCYGSSNFPPGLGVKFEVHCDRLDSELKPQVSMYLPIPKNNFVYGQTCLTHRTDQHGNTYVAIEQAPFYKPDLHDHEMSRIRSFTYDNQGKLIESRDYDKIAVSMRKGFLWMFSYLSPDDKFYVITDHLIDRYDEEIYVRQIIRALDI